MAGESFYNATVGSGFKFHSWNRTIGANSVEDQIVQLGEPYLASYVVGTTPISCANAGDDILQIMAGASLNVRIRRIRVEQGALITAAAISQFEVARVTTAGTAGTAVTPSKKDNGDAASGATAATGVPNATHGTIGAIFWFRSIWPVQTAPAGGVAMPYWEWVQEPNTKPIIIPAGTTNGIVIRNTVARAGLSVSVEIEFDESSFVL